MTIQKIIERLLRARLYRQEALVRLRSGARHRLRIAELQYDGSRSAVLVHRPDAPRRPWSIPLREVEAVSFAENGPEAA